MLNVTFWEYLPILINVIVALNVLNIFVLRAKRTEKWFEIRGEIVPFIVMLINTIYIYRLVMDLLAVVLFVGYCVSLVLHARNDGLRFAEWILNRRVGLARLTIIWIAFGFFAGIEEVDTISYIADKHQPCDFVEGALHGGPGLPVCTDGQVCLPVLPMEQIGAQMDLDDVPGICVHR